MKLKLGTYPIYINNRKARMYPDSGASLTVVPTHLVDQKDLTCKNKVTVLNGRSVSMKKTTVYMKFRNKIKKIDVHIAPHMTGDIVWVGYPQLRLFGIHSIDIKNTKRNFTTSSPSTSCNL